MTPDGTYLLNRSIADSVGIIIIINDFKVLYSISLSGSTEVHINWGFSCPFGKDCKMRWLPIFDTFKYKKRKKRTLEDIFFQGSLNYPGSSSQGYDKLQWQGCKCLFLFRLCRQLAWAKLEGTFKGKLKLFGQYFTLSL